MTPAKPAVETISPMDLSEKLTEYHKNGLPKGDSTGWWSLDPHYTVLPGQWTLITGIPGHGKSEWLDALMVNLARTGWCFSVFSPENFPHEMHVAKLLEKILKKPFGRGPSDRITTDEMAGAVAWMDSHFGFLKPVGDLQIPNIQTVIEAGSNWINAHDKQAGKVQKYGIIVDPWNELEHKRPTNLTETEYIGQTLSYVRQFAREFNVHPFIVAHPRIIHKDKDGKRPVPTPYDISGSANWYNKADNIITIWRDTNPETKSNEVQVHVQKIRFKNIGSPDMVTLRYDRVCGLYHDMNPPSNSNVRDFKIAASGDAPL